MRRERGLDHYHCSDCQRMLDNDDFIVCEDCDGNDENEDSQLEHFFTGVMLQRLMSLSIPMNSNPYRS
jgi:hypothetical protein